MLPVGKLVKLAVTSTNGHFTVDTAFEKTNQLDLAFDPAGIEVDDEWPEWTGWTSDLLSLASPDPNADLKGWVPDP